jgi:hypothetical protein
VAVAPPVRPAFRRARGRHGGPRTLGHVIAPSSRRSGVLQPTVTKSGPLRECAPRYCTNAPVIGNRDGSGRVGAVVVCARLTISVTEEESQP